MLRASGNIPNQYRLEYYTDETCKKLDGFIDLDQCEQADVFLELEDQPIIYNGQPLCVFDLKTTERTYYFGCQNKEELKQWMDCICQVSEMKSSSDIEGGRTKAVFVPIASTLSSSSLSSSSSSSAPATTNRILLRTLRGQLSEEERYSPQPGPIQVVEIPESNTNNNCSLSTNQTFYSPGIIILPAKNLQPPARYQSVRANPDRPTTKTKAPNNGEEADDEDELDGDGVSNSSSGVFIPSRPPPTYPPPPPPSLSNKARCQSPSISSVLSTSTTSTILPLPPEPPIMPTHVFSSLYGQNLLQPQTSTSNQSKVLNYIPISECYSGKPTDRWKMENNNENIPPPPIPPKPISLVRSQTQNSHSSLTLLNRAEKERALRKLLDENGISNEKLSMFGACSLNNYNNNLESFNEKPLVVTSYTKKCPADLPYSRTMERSFPQRSPPPIVDRSKKPHQAPGMSR